VSENKGVNAYNSIITCPIMGSYCIVTQRSSE